MRCKLCNKIVMGVPAYQTHLRMKHNDKIKEIITLHFKILGYTYISGGCFGLILLIIASVN